MGYYVIIRGPLECGKTTISKKLAQILKAEYFSVDKVLEENGLEKELEGGYISRQSFKKANQLLAPRAQKILNKGKIAVFDGNFYWKSQIEDLISRLDSTWFAFTLKAPLEVCIKRDKKRSRSLGESAARTVFLKSSKFEYGLAIDVDKPVTKCLREILCRLPDC